MRGLSVKRPYQIASVTMFCLSAYLAYASLRLRFYTPLGPGPGFFPLWLSILLALLAAAMFWQATFSRPEPMPDDFFPDRTGVLRMGAVVVALIGVIALMESVGFCLAMLAFYLFLLLVLGRQHPVVTGIIALAGSFGVYYVFVRWLAVSLPVGLFGL
jgi:putative tricarboxylic transport membrane protein